MEIPRSYIDNYSKSLNKISEEARSALSKALGRLDYDASIEDIRNAVISVMQPMCGASADTSARLASEFYNGLRGMFGVQSEYTAEAVSLREPDATSGAVRAFVEDLVENKPLSDFIGKCVDRIDYEIRRAANECMAWNAKRDPAKPKWARVPTGLETCEWCIMLASRGFVYHSEETASHAHAHCDCRIVPSWDRRNPAVQGYSSDKYYDEWIESGFKAPSGRRSDGASARSAKDLGRGSRFDGLSEMVSYINSARDMDELYARASTVLADINNNWNGRANMIQSASRAAKEMRTRLDR